MLRDKCSSLASLDLNTPSKLRDCESTPSCSVSNSSHCAAYAITKKYNINKSLVKSNPAPPEPMCDKSRLAVLVSLVQVDTIKYFYLSYSGSAICQICCYSAMVFLADISCAIDL